MAKPHPLMKLLYIVLDYYDMPVSEVRRITKKPQIVQIRQVYMYIAYTTMDGYTIGRIGGFVFQSANTTRNGIERIRDLLINDKQLQEDVSKILETHKP